MKEDVLEVVQDFIQGASFIRFYASSFIVLLPKVKDPQSFDKFFPISLCYVAYKICSKLIVKRLTSILPQLISPELGAFILGRSIFEIITLAHKMVHFLN